MKGWVYYVDYPGMDKWRNASDHGIYHILDAPHVLEMNRHPRFQCLDCGYIFKGWPEDDCDRCESRKKRAAKKLVKNSKTTTTRFLEKLLKANEDAKKSTLFFGDKGE
jgi:hypothetical protein